MLLKEVEHIQTDFLQLKAAQKLHKQQKHRLITVEQENNQLKSERVRLVESHNQWSSEKLRIQQQMDMLVAEKQTLTNQLSQARSANQLSEQKLQLELKALQDTVRVSTQRVETTQTTMMSETEEVNRLRQTVATNGTVISTLRAQLRDAQDETATARRQLQQQQTRQEVVQLTADLENEKARHLKVVRQLESFGAVEKERDRLQLELINRNEVAAMLRNQLRTAQQEIERVQRPIDTESEQSSRLALLVQQLKAELEQEKTSHRETAKTAEQVDTVTAQAQSLQQQIVANDASIRTLKSELHEARNDATAMTNELEEVSG